MPELSDDGADVAGGDTAVRWAEVPGVGLQDRAAAVEGRMIAGLAAG